MKAAGKQPEFSLRELRNELKNTNFAPSKEGIMAAEIDQHDHVTELLWNKKWQVMVASDDSGGFVTTDDPVTIRWTDGQEHADRPGIADPNSEIVFPLSNMLTLRGRPEGAEGVVTADAAMVAEINDQIIAGASRQVFAYNHSFKFARGEEQRSGATLNQDEQFLQQKKPAGDSKVVALKAN
ncbi:DUF4238 domain-containing protein [Bradyrhizobium sp. 48]|uniref:DUF4238 domain-containing protein n=1 Tax=Bradyrhizobium sp. 48 TaxID=2782676 RepID=UPI002097C461|nr:DUF4238 domain-containing protein [Bradyrhizobium sp. 48]MCK1447703.1 DUF4238 domain-containing protein [Bradyrhizobium sp. 48]